MSGDVVLSRPSSRHHILSTFPPNSPWGLGIQSGQQHEHHEQVTGVLVYQTDPRLSTGPLGALNEGLGSSPFLTLAIQEAPDLRPTYQGTEYSY